jgi:predicted regulator of amino acid metabolism with ACT domain
MYDEYEEHRLSALRRLYFELDPVKKLKANNRAMGRRIIKLEEKVRDYSSFMKSLSKY